MEYAKMFFAALPFLFPFILSLPFLWLHFCHNKGGKSSILPRNWPILGVIPSFLVNLHRPVDFTNEVLQQSQGTFMFKGPWFTKMELLATADPNNVQYVMSKHHDRFNRGPSYEQIFEGLGDGIFNSEHDKWRYQRRIALTFFISVGFRQFTAKTIRYKIERGLIPLLERSFMKGSIIDLQDVFQRLTGDITWMSLIDHDPNFLSCENDHPSSINAIRDLSGAAEEVVIIRHALPSCIWKMLRYFRIGKEREYVELKKAVDSFIYDFIKSKREDMMKGSKGCPKNGDGYGIDLFSYYMEENYGTESHGFKSTEVFLRDTFANFFFAGQDTVSAALAWLFWLITRHPRVEAKIKYELRDEDINMDCDPSQLSDPNKLVYLHATIYEALRLYPPVPYNHRAPYKQETLPSGHLVKPNTTIILCAYAMGRMKWVWGDDADVFKPERWITEQGTIKHEPSYKFFTFNSGPRICLGKDMAIMQMKAVVCAVLRHKYSFKIMEGHRVDLAPPIILRMKHGLKVRVTKYKAP